MYIKTYVYIYKAVYGLKFINLSTALLNSDTFKFVYYYDIINACQLATSLIRIN